MNWDAIRFDWNHTRAFLAVCEEGNLSAAARVLKQTQPTLGRQIAALEDRLGILLFERIGHRLILTDAGAQLREHARAMSDAAHRMSITASGQSQEIEGRVVITASDLFASHLLIPIVTELRSKAPGLTIDIVATNDISNLLQRDADIALRHVRPEQPDLIARLICDAKADFYAATTYLDQRGRPKNEAELSTHDFIAYGNTGEMIGHLSSMGLRVTERNFKAGSANGLVAWDMVRQGLGVSVMSRDVGRATPQVEQVLPDRPPFLFPVWLVTHRELHTARRIRLVFDHIADALPRMMA